MRDVPTSQGATTPTPIFAGAGGWEGKSKDEGRNQLPHSSENICDKPREY